MKTNTFYTTNPYVNILIDQFIRFVVPRGKTCWVVSAANISKKIINKYDYIVLVQILEETGDIIDYLQYIHAHLVPGG
ncbi:hypothetical protein HY338_02640, partial [Candidatus Gottesmanbacteria bacterium]|nr:hypothetical protein [Candidatus Gottesmanbacteria bacterium]